MKCNKCEILFIEGNIIVEFFNSHHSNPNDPDMADEGSETRDEGMFRFEKRMDSSYKTDPLPQRSDR